MVAFQRFHNSTPKAPRDAEHQLWSTAAKLFAGMPDVVHSREKAVYATMDAAAAAAEGAPSC